MHIDNRFVSYTSRNGRSNATRFRARPGETIGDETLQRVAPSIFATSAHESRSDRFVTIPTIAALEALRAQGFGVVEVRQGGSRVEGKREFTKHMLRLQHASMSPVRALGELFPEVVLVNANDGTAAYNISAGLFRLVCLNGLTVRDSTSEAVRVSHVGRPDQVISRVVEGSFSVMAHAPATIEAAAAMDDRRATPEIAGDMANRAAVLRWGHDEKGTIAAPIAPHLLTLPRRTADNRDSVWTMFNRIQENLMRGGQRYVIRGERRGEVLQRRTVAPLNGIDDDRRINRELWAMAVDTAATAPAMLAR